MELSKIITHEHFAYTILGDLLAEHGELINGVFSEGAYASPLYGGDYIAVVFFEDDNCVANIRLKTRKIADVPKGFELVAYVLTTPELSGQFNDGQVKVIENAVQKLKQLEEFSILIEVD